MSLIALCTLQARYQKTYKGAELRTAARAQRIATATRTEYGPQLQVIANGATVWTMAASTLLLAVILTHVRTLLVCAVSLDLK